MIAFPFLTVVAHALRLTSTDPAPLQSCLHYEPDTVAITGVLSRRTFFGPPNFGENPKTDEKEVGFYLDVAKGVCTVAGRDTESYAAKHGVKRIQLVLDSAGYSQLRPSLGKSITVRGTMFASFTGHHHAPLLLIVNKPSKGA